MGLSMEVNIIRFGLQLVYIDVVPGFDALIVDRFVCLLTLLYYDVTSISNGSNYSIFQASVCSDFICVYLQSKIVQKAVLQSSHSVNFILGSPLKTCCCFDFETVIHQLCLFAAAKSSVLTAGFLHRTQILYHLLGNCLYFPSVDLECDMEHGYYFYFENYLAKLGFDLNCSGQQNYSY